MTRIRLPLATALLLIAGAARAEAVDTLAECQKYAAAWQATYNKGDADALAAMYTKDGTYSGVFWTASSQPAIAQGFKAEMAAGSKFTAIACTQSHRAGAIGYSDGTWDAMAKGPDGKDMPVKGHWLTVTRFHDGKYAILDHTANMQLSPPGK